MNTTIGQRIGTCFAVTFLASGGLSYFAYNRLEQLNAETESARVDSGQIIQIDALEDGMEAINGRSLEHTTDPAEDDKAALDKEINEGIEKGDAILTDYGNSEMGDEEHAAYYAVVATRKTWLDGVREMLQFSHQAKTADAMNSFHNKADPAFDDVRSAIDKLRKINVDSSGEEGNNVTALANTATRGLIIGALISVLVGAAAVRVIISVNRILRGLADSLRRGSLHLSSASAEVSGSSQGLAQGASEQAASLEETSSSLEEISSMTKKNADTAHQASLLSSEAKEVSDKGNIAMTKMSTAIVEIQKSASETAKILKTIDEIAFQTNLLALNAAVEAARAGEAGKGFAVVAEEVRNLAMRSAEAAKNTAALIEGSVQNAKNGVKIAEEVAQALTEITAANGKVNLLVAEIAAASSEQAQGVNQVNQAVQQMDKITQSNAATAEESAASAEELSSQSEQVRDIVTQLRVLVQGARATDAEETVSARRPPRSGPRKAAPKGLKAAKAQPGAASSEIPFDEPAKSDQDFSDFNVAA